MKTSIRPPANLILLLTFVAPTLADHPNGWESASGWDAPSQIVADPRTGRVFVACERSRKVLVLSQDHERVIQEIGLDGIPTGLAVSVDPFQLVVTVSGPTGAIVIFNDQGEMVGWRRAPAGVCAPALDATGRRLFVCYRHSDLVGIIDIPSLSEVGRIPALREPVALALAPNQRQLVVVNHLPEGSANRDDVGVSVTLMDVEELRVVRDLKLPPGSTQARGVAISSSGRWAVVTHNVAHFNRPTITANYGWIGGGAFSVLDLWAEAVVAACWLDDPYRGAANPWGVGWTKDDREIYIVHSGTHDLSVLETDRLLEKLNGVPQGVVVNDLTFLAELRERVPLPMNGPRALCIGDGSVYVGGFFSDSIVELDRKGRRIVDEWILRNAQSTDLVRLGEQLFHDATLSHQSWLSCASCHPEGRSDGVNWDLLNDGEGNPKNTKSLVLSWRTPPMMSLGVRPGMGEAVRAGIRHILFTEPLEEIARPIEAYLTSLTPETSPWSNGEDLSEVVQRGAGLFQDPKVGCAHCHRGPELTDLAAHQVGTANAGDHPGQRFDTPTLVECWRTAPYLHDGSAATIEDVLVSRNTRDQHGVTSHLTAQELADLEVYILSR